MALKIENMFDIPSLPNFLRLKGSKNGSYAFPVEQLSDKELRKLGKLWTGALIEHAKKRRKSNG